MQGFLRFLGIREKAPRKAPEFDWICPVLPENDTSVANKIELAPQPPAFRKAVLEGSAPWGANSGTAPTQAAGADSPGRPLRSALPMCSDVALEAVSALTA